MFSQVFVDRKLSVEYISGEDFVQKILDPCQSKKFSLAQSMYWTSALELQRYFYPLQCLEDCMQTSWNFHCKTTMIG